MSEEKGEQEVPDQAGALFNRILGEIFERRVRESIRSVYSNNAHFQSSELDFKILFGQLSHTPNKMAVDWHTAVTMTWAQAKMLSYYLRVNLAAYEANYGIVKVPTGMLPGTFAAPEDIDTNPASKKMFDTIQGVRSELMDEQLKLWPENAAPHER